MSISNFVKGECHQCRGHLEFPAEAVGQTITCPHCGQPTELAAAISANKNKASGRFWLVAGAIIFVVMVGLGAVIFISKKSNGDSIAKTQTPLPAPTNTPVIFPAPPVVETNSPVAVDTNDFAILPFKLEKARGSSLVYVTGTIRNETGRQRFGVKVEFGLFDTNDNVVGKATDYHAMLDPHGDWQFKAMVMESKATAARFNSIREDR